MKYKILEMLNTDEYVSGGEISKKLGISRNAVWKHINALRKLGYEISSVPSRGYRLEKQQDIINPEVLKAHVPGKVYYYESADSTNAVCKRTENVPDGSLFVSDTQTEGRGRLGRKWTSPKGCAVYMSLYLEPDIPVEKVSQLTLIAGMAVCRAIRSSRIKWPNDVLLNNKKICGILTEMTAEADRINHVIIGIGINVNNELFTVDLIEKATSLYRETGTRYRRDKLICDIIDEFKELYGIYLKDGFSALKREYSLKCVTLNRQVIIVRNGAEFEARAVDIDANGGLVIEHDGVRETVTSGEVSVRGFLGYN